MKRIDSLDLLKFIAMMMVIVYHSFFAPYGYINYYIKAILGTGVPIFFMCSGYILLNRELNVPKIQKAVVKYIFVALFWSIITGLMIKKIWSEPVDVYNFFCNIKDGTGVVVHYWYLGALVCIYMVFPFIKMAKDSNNAVYKWGFIILGIMTIGNRLINAAANIIQWNLYSNVWRIDAFGMFNPYRGIYSYALFYFVLGGVLGDNKVKEKIEEVSKKYRWVLVLLLLISNLCLTLFGVFWSKVYSYLYNTDYIYDIVSSAYDSIFTLCSSVIIFLLADNYKYSDNVVKKYIRLVSQNTLCIYLVHMVFINAGWAHKQEFIFKFFYNRPSMAMNIAYAFLITNISLIISVALKRIKISKYIL